MKKGFNFVVLLLLSLVWVGFAFGEPLLYPIQINEKFGYIDEKGDEVIPAQWDEASSFIDGFAIVGNGASYNSGIIGLDGKVYVDMKYNIEYQNGLFILRKDDNQKDLFGYFDSQSLLTVEPQYDYIGNKHASEATQLVFTMMGGKVGYLNRSTGEIQIPFMYDEPADQAQFIDGFAIAVVADSSSEGIDVKMHLITVENAEVLFSAGIQVYADPFIGISEGKIAIENTENGTKGFADLNGEIICPPQYDSVYRFSEGYAAVCREGLWGHIDTSGKVIVTPRFSLYNGDDIPIGYEFHNGIALLRTREEYLAINPQGDILFTKPFVTTENNLSIFPFMDNGLALCRVEDEYGLINSAGEWVCVPRWRLTEEWSRDTFSSSLEAVSIEGKYGFINSKGEFQIECQYEYAENFNGTLALVIKNGKTAYINRNNDVVWEEI